MPPAADWALAVADFSARLESMYDGKRNTVATKTAKEIKKRRTTKNLT
jgi:osmotically-inducible protein OsmY